MDDLALPRRVISFGYWGRVLFLGFAAVLQLLSSVWSGDLGSAKARETQGPKLHLYKSASSAPTFDDFVTDGLCISLQSERSVTRAEVACIGSRSPRHRIAVRDEGTLEEIRGGLIEAERRVFAYPGEGGFGGGGAIAEIRVLVGDAKLTFWMLTDSAFTIGPLTPSRVFSSPRLGQAILKILKQNGIEHIPM